MSLLTLAPGEQSIQKIVTCIRQLIQYLQGIWVKVTGGITYSGGNVGIGAETTPQTLLSVSANAAKTLSAPADGTVLRVVNSDNNGTFIVCDSFGTFSQFLARRADGTAALPSAIQADEPIASYGGRGYGTTAYSNHESGQIAILATAAWTDTNWPAYINFKTVANGDATRTLRTRMTLLDNGKFGIGDTNPQSPLTVSSNAAQGLNSGLAATALIIGADGGATGTAIVAYGSGTNGMVGLSAGGTGASPSATVAGSRLNALGGAGFGTTFTTSRAIITLEAVNTWSVSDNSTLITLQTTPSGSTSRAEAARIQGSGGVSIGSTNDGGLGTLLLKPQAFASLSAASSTTKGAVAVVTDSNTNVWGATIAAGGANIVLAFCDGTNWTVAGK